MRLAAITLSALMSAACTMLPQTQTDALSDIAPAYVKLILGIGEHEDGYVDAYYGPAEWKAEARTSKRLVA